MGNGFPTEDHLVKAIIECAKSARRREYKLELELDAGVGIADVVLCKRTTRSTRALNILAKAPPRIAALFDQRIGKEITSRTKLATCLGISESSAQRLILKLVAAGLISSHGDEISIPTIRTPPFSEIIAIEAKISNWQQALVQAYRNIQFSDESWVVLDHRFHRPAVAQLDRFSRAGVGLASIDDSNMLFVHCVAKESDAVSHSKRWQAQAALSRRARENARRSKLPTY